MQVQLLGGTAPLKFWRAKDVKNLVRYKTTSSLSANISGTDGAINTCYMALSSTISPTLNKKL